MRRLGARMYRPTARVWTFAALIAGALLAASTAAAGVTKTPTCSSVNVASINATIGGGAKPTLVSSSSGNGQLGCDYGGTHNVNVNFTPHMTASVFKLLPVGYKGEFKGEKAVSGIGTSAYTATATTNGQPTQYLWVFAGTYAVTIIATKTTAAAEEALARKVVPLV